MGSLTNIGSFDEWLLFFVRRMTIRDISENGNQDKVALIVCDMKNFFKRHVGWNISKEEKRPVKCSHGSGREEGRSDTQEIMSIKTWSVIIERL